MRRRLIVIVAAALLALVGCGGGRDGDSRAEYVRGAMAELPYQYRLSARLSTDDYLVFRTTNPRKDVDVDMAFGLPSKTHGCPKLPEALAKRRYELRPFVGASAGPLICLAVKSVQPVDDEEDAIVVVNMANRTAVTLCEQAHGGWACFD